MNICFVAILGIITVLFLLKMLYVFCTAWVIRITRGALFVTTPNIRIETFLQYIPVDHGSSVVDLGCGDGRVLRKIRKHFNVKALGYEINPFAYMLAKIFCCRDKKIRIKRRDFLDKSLAEFDIIFCYLFPDVMEELTIKLQNEAGPDTVFISCNFPLKGQMADQVLVPEKTRHNEPIFIYYF